MSTQSVSILSLNAGEISRLALARVDLAKLRMACEVQRNWLPHVLGPCQFRPGTRYIVDMPAQAAGWLGEFYYDESTKALLVVTAAGMQFLVNDAYLTRPTVTAAVTNGTFNTDITGWTDSDEAGAASDFGAGGYARFTGTGTNFAYLDQQITVNEVGVEHALRVVVERNTVVVKVGSAIGLAGYLDVTLLPGVYSLAFTPSGNFWIRIGASSTYSALIDSVTVESPGVISLPVPWTTTAHFDSIRYDQSGDILFVASAGFQQRRIERRSPDSRSWGIARYFADDGPFRLANLSNIQLTPSGTTGSINLPSNRDVFRAGHVGALFKLTHSGQSASGTLGAANVFTNPIRISGLTSHNGSASSRSFAITVDGTFVATVTLQRSIGAVGSWTDVENYTAPTSKSFDDGLDNQIIFYRLGIKAGNYTSGSATAALGYAGSIQAGIVRISSVADGITATADVLQELGQTTATGDWSEGEWSDYRGFPAAVALDGGRLVWGGGIKAQHSISDAFASFDEDAIGDSGPINKTIVSGGLSGIRWFLSLGRLLVGTISSITSVRASAFDEPLTPTAYVAKECSDDGAEKVRPLKLGKIGVYAGFRRLFKLVFDLQQGDYDSQAIDRLKPEMFAAGIRDLAVQRKPDNAQVWAILGDGKAVLATLNQREELEAMHAIETPGSFERVAVLRGSDEDDVYFIVFRLVNGVARRSIEKLAKRSECVGGLLNKTMDSHIVYSGGPTATLSGGLHLAGLEVVVWADGAPLVTRDAMRTVSSDGQITLPAACTNAVWGLPYTGDLRTVKLAYAAEHGTALTMRKRVSGLGLVLADVAWKGLRYGRDGNHFTSLPATYKARVLGVNEVFAAYDAQPGSFGGAWDSDSRVYLQINSPYCATIMALVVQMTTNEPEDAPPKPEKPEKRDRG